MLSKVFFVAGLVSIIASIVAWNLASWEAEPLRKLHTLRDGVYSLDFGLQRF